MQPASFEAAWDSCSSQMKGWLALSEEGKVFQRCLEIEGIEDSGPQTLLFLLFFSELLYPLQLLVLRRSQAALRATPTWERNRERARSPTGTS